MFSLAVCYEDLSTSLPGCRGIFLEARQFPPCRADFFDYQKRFRSESCGKPNSIAELRERTKAKTMSGATLASLKKTGKKNPIQTG